MVENRFTRLGVFEGEKLLGWVTLTDLAREFSKPHLLKAIMARAEPEDKQVLCPNCRKAFLEKITNTAGVILRWECPNCRYSLYQHRSGSFRRDPSSSHAAASPVPPCPPR